MNLKDIAQKIEDEEWIYVDENGEVDGKYIINVFGLTDEQYSDLLGLLYNRWLVYG